MRVVECRNEEAQVRAHEYKREKWTELICRVE